MYSILLIELFHWIFLLVFPVYAIFLCSSNDRDREQMHLERRQALRDRQREAVISGKSVRSVIETEVEPEPTPCPVVSRLSCVRMAPKLKTHSGVNTAEVYERLNQNDNSRQKMEKEKPPSAEIKAPKAAPKTKLSNESDEEIPDERSKLATDKDKESAPPSSSY